MEPLHTFADELVSPIGRLSPEDEAAQKDGLSVSSKTEAIAQNRSAGTLPRVTGAFSSYVKKMAAGEISGTAPPEQAFIPIKALVRHLENEKEFTYDISDVRQTLVTSPAKAYARPDSSGTPGAQTVQTNRSRENTEKNLKKDCYTVESKGKMVRGRDGLISLIRLEQICDIDAFSCDPRESLVLVVESREKKKGDPCG